MARRRRPREPLWHVVTAFCEGCDRVVARFQAREDFGEFLAGEYKAFGYAHYREQGRDPAHVVRAGRPIIHTLTWDQLEAEREATSAT